MSIGVGMTLPDGVVLAADGRLVHPQAKIPTEPANNVDKIVAVGPTSFAIPFGVTQATDEALKILQDRIRSDSPPEDFLSLVDFSVNAAWAFLNTRLDSNVNPNHPSMRAALIVGGLAKQIPFVTVSLHGPNINQKPLLLKGCDYQYVLLGGENHNAKQFFAQDTRKLMGGLTWDSTVGPMNPTVRAIVDAFVNTVHYVEALDPAVGGTIRYAIIRKGFPIEKIEL